MFFTYSCSAEVMVTKSDPASGACTVRGVKRNQKIATTATNAAPVAATAATEIFCFSGADSGCCSDPCMALDRSAPQRQPMCQRFGQTCGAHSFLHFLHSIRHAPEFDCVIFQIGDGKTSPGVAVARLSHGSRIQQISRFCFHAEGAMLFIISRMKLQHFEL